ncbi:MAG: hypothetical protein BGO88_07925 [Flavobacterium sp. 38-13]|uniref:serine hydrolase domain-containing protein n=1 Tax=Flavobacterium sp. 38-13 TaxID=1896168 RepID=UPI00095CD85D|nr:serine hydrolase domain-containing protein [Flavobacterium sp. 38-13]OJX51105.1 MAG: hypothetical protein BGO88_07925 [Flavobacterium sp. 38-13]
MKNKILILFVLFTCAGFSQSKLLKIIGPYKDSIKDFGMVALVESKDKVYIENIGFEKNAPSPNDQLFCIGSTSKLYISCLILQLIEEKKLSLDDPLSKFNIIRKNENISANITIKNLLSHSSGIQDYLTATTFNSSFLQPYEDFSRTAFYKLINSKSFAPNEKNEYSNSNYFILKEIIEEIEDKALHYVVEERIIKPLKLEHTKTYYSKNIPGLASSYASGMNLDDFPKLGINNFSDGVGNFVTTAKELNIFIRALFFSNRLINSQSAKILTTIVQLQGTTKNKYFGIGTLKFKNDQYNLFGYAGRTISYSSAAYVDTDSKQSYILLLNSAEFSKDAADKIIVQMIKDFK